MKNGKELIAEERLRQIEKEGWTPAHDDQHTDGSLAKAAAVYATVEEGNVIRILQQPRENGWPWDIEWFKPFGADYVEFPEVDRIRCLVKAGALIAAEIDRLQRAAEREKEDDQPKVIATAGQILDRGVWDEFCEMRGLNPWAVAEGLMGRDEAFELTFEQAAKLGLIA